MLKEANALSGDQIRIGQTLTIPSRTGLLVRPDNWRPPAPVSHRIHWWSPSIR
jgi:LysM repeat protein